MIESWGTSPQSLPPVLTAWTQPELSHHALKDEGLTAEKTLGRILNVRLVTAFCFLPFGLAFKYKNNPQLR